ncbi:hypothetical protein LVJ94_26740 [Pendulispora rubella]|uniref:Uncharacterized protein n=1 Tax=Pendulispora rubella TaxID=2741070 RepID=A0ABZ2KW27_9BACT
MSHSLERATMFDYLFTVMGPIGSAAVLATLLIALTFVVFIANAVNPKRLRGH